MKAMSSAEIRQAFLDFFREQGHEVVPTSPLVPGNDPSLLFTNAGMVQFKDVFLGTDRRSYRRAASSQRCVRAGGKHNDLENVGYTARHHTFFEMLGNFSFGDYFKEDAIRFAWTFLTSEHWLGLSEEKLWVTVYAEDEDAYRIWHQDIGIPASRLVRIGDQGGRYESDNFWAMGDTGPCGPCSEIFYDHGPEVAGGPPGSPEEDGDRYIEIWNIVFMQYVRSADGEMAPLPRPSVDTGMGLERIAAVIQGVHSNYEIDLFRRLLEAAREVTGAGDPESQSLQVIADHIRSCAFLIVDAVLPSNEGRGYVLRRIIRRAIRHGHKLGQEEPFFHRLVAPLVAEMGDAYPELKAAQSSVEDALLKEERQFARTLSQGMGLLDQAIAALTGDEIPGETIFKLYDTYGFPVDLTADIARERGLGVDIQGFEAAMEKQRQRARAAGSFGVDYSDQLSLDACTRFEGYEALELSSATQSLFRQGEPVERLAAGEEGLLVVEQTPFYAEAGGQVGDTGLLEGDSGRAQVTDTTRQGDAVLHHLRVVEGHLSPGQSVRLQVDAQRRRRTALNHSATHLLHAALRELLGDQVTQRGSLVDAERLRFDFSHDQPLTQTQVQQLEEQVNASIRANLAVDTQVMSLEDARRQGAMALFGEKYDDRVRVVRMGEVSLELCGGTHVQRTGDIGFFKIVEQAGIAAGVRRLEAVTGPRALAWVQHLEARLLAAAGRLKSSPEQLVDRVAALQSHSRGLERELEQLKGKLASAAGNDLAGQARDVAGVPLLASRLEGVDPKALREILDQLKNKLGSAVILLATVEGDKVSLVAGVTPDLTGRFQAGQLIREVAGLIGGKGGGRPDMAQGGGNNPEGLVAALEAATDWVRARAQAD